MTAAPPSTGKPITLPTQLGMERVGAARYAVWRRFEVAGEFHARHIECANPAYGFAQLHAWEAGIRLDAARARAAS